MAIDVNPEKTASLSSPDPDTTASTVNDQQTLVTPHYTCLDDFLSGDLKYLTDDDISCINTAIGVAFGEYPEDHSADPEYLANEEWLSPEYDQVDFYTTCDSTVDPANSCDDTKEEGGK